MRSIQTKEEFDKLMLEIDDRMQKRGDPIHTRQLLAVGEVSEALGCMMLRLVGYEVTPTPGIYTGDSLSAHIRDWFDERYGDRLKVRWVIGYSAVLLKGDAWLLRFPLVYGQLEIVCDRDLSRQYNSMSNTASQKAQMNLLNLIENCPQGLANILSESELKGLLDYFILGYDFFLNMHNFGSDHDLSATAVTDLETSARSAIGDQHDYGQSLWASLQAAEKVLKFFISSKAGNFKYTHHLRELADKAHSLGLQRIDSDIIDKVQCKADVRYSQQIRDIKKVINSHQAALKIGSIVTNDLYGTRQL